MFQLASGEECEVLKLLALGMTYQEIADTEGVCTKTVQRMVARFRKAVGEGKQ